MAQYKEIRRTDIETGSRPEHDPLSTMGMAPTEIKEMMKAEVLRHVDEFIHERLAEMVTTMIPSVLSESLQDRLEACSILEKLWLTVS